MAAPAVEVADQLPIEAALILICVGTILLTLTAFGLVRFIRSASAARRAIYASLAAFLSWSGAILFGGVDLKLNLLVCALLGIPAVIAAGMVYFRELGREKSPNYEPLPPIDWRQNFEFAGALMIGSPLLAGIFAVGYSIYFWLRNARWPDMSTLAFTGIVNSDWVGFNMIINGILSLHVAFPLIALFGVFVWLATEIEDNSAK